WTAPAPLERRSVLTALLSGRGRRRMYAWRRPAARYREHRRDRRYARHADAGEEQAAPRREAADLDGRNRGRRYADYFVRPGVDVPHLCLDRRDRQSEPPFVVTLIAPAHE